MNTLILTFQLLKPFDPYFHTGINRLLSVCKVASIGDNAFLICTILKPSEILEQLQHHLVKKEFLCVFTVTDPAVFFVPEFIGKQINTVLEGEMESRDTIPPVEM